MATIGGYILHQIKNNICKIFVFLFLVIIVSKKMDWNDYDQVLAEVKQNGWSLMRASKELTCNENIVMLVVISKDNST